MSLVYQNVLSAQDYCSLRAAVCWPALDPAQAQAALAGSSQIAACYDGAHAVGAARVLYDGACLACLTDIMVLPYYQGRGIGKALVQRLLAFVQAQRPAQRPAQWPVKVVVMAAKGKEPFYQSLGFSACPNGADGAGMVLWLPARP